MPIPLSETSSLINILYGITLICTFPPSGVYLIALSTILAAASTVHFLSNTAVSSELSILNSIFFCAAFNLYCCSKACKTLLILCFLGFTEIIPFSNRDNFTSICKIKFYFNTPSFIYINSFYHTA